MHHRLVGSVIQEPSAQRDAEKLDRFRAGQNGAPSQDLQDADRGVGYFGLEISLRQPQMTYYCVVTTNYDRLRNGAMLDAGVAFK